ncbi:MAG: hypothetical protein HC925_07635 [Coleofasciculaceae cyanobacterium SM2_3_26]|nr:hypothetical protein [Coleofasciculaceae cyanobacterium SM2_3_26]
MYASVEGESKVVRIDLQTGDRAQVFVGESPRGMALSADGSFLYVANYHTHTLSKIRTSDLEVIQTQKTNPSPTSIAYDPETRQVWVSCASGSVQVFQD